MLDNGRGSREEPNLDNGTMTNSTRRLQCCLFCYKSCNDANENNNICGSRTSSNNAEKTTSEGNPSHSLITKFLRLFQRYLNDSNSSGKCVRRTSTLFPNIIQLLESCQDCSFLLRDFCSLYDKIKCLELKLDWRLKNLLEIIKCAEKVPSRVKAFRNHIDLNDFWDNSEEALLGIQNFRNEFKVKCSAKFQSTHPRIVLKRIGLSQTAYSGLETTKRVKAETTTVKSERNATTSATISENKTETFERNESGPLPTAPEVDEDQNVAVSSVFLVKVSASDDYDENFERNTIAVIERRQRETSFQHSDLVADNVNDTYLPSPPPTSPILSPGVTGTDEDDGEQGFSSSTIPSDNEYLVNEKNGVNPDHNRNVRSKIKKEIPGHLNGESITVRAANNEREINKIVQVKFERESSFANTNEVPMKVEKIFKTRKKSAKTHFKADKVDYQRRHSKRLLKKAKTIAKAKSVCRKGGKGRKIRRYDVYPSISNGKRILLSLKQLALNKVMRLRKKLRCRVQPCENKSFINPRDFINHSKYHGEFKCNFCEKILTYAPDLFTHEINDHHEPRKGLKKSQACSRCSYSCSTRGRNHKSVLIHFFESHLNIIPAKNTCSICGATISTSKVSVRKGFFEHYRSHHDLADVDISKVKKCDVSNCRAYFRTYFQLDKHKLKIHEITTKMKYLCRDCGKQFQSLLDMQHHQLNHTMQTLFKVPCPLPECEKLFETEADLLHHKRHCHRNERIPCPQCNKLIGKPHLESHLRRHKTLDTHKLRIYRCLESGCKKEFYNVLDLENHSRLHGEFSCQFCDAVITFAANLPIHEINCQKRDNVDEEDGSEGFACTRCKLCVKRKFIAHFVEKHLHLKMDGHTCFICKAQISLNGSPVPRHFKRMHDLKNVGPDGKTYACKIDGCSAYFLKQHQLLRHKNYHITTAGKFKMRRDDGDGKAYECGDCNKRFKTIIQLRKHRVLIHLHMNLKTITCISDACKLRFETQAELDDHLNKNDLLKCPKCEKSFHGAHGLKLHETFHKNQEAGKSRKRWVCENCGKAFNGEERLRLHRFSHTGPDTWEFMCNICSKKCLTKDKLNDHMRTHTNEKPFICEICGVKYAHRHNLRIHVNNKHGDIVTDKPRNFDKTNLTSRKGVKVKKQKQEEEAGTSQKKGSRKRESERKVKTSKTRRRRKKPCADSSSDSN